MVVLESDLINLPKDVERAGEREDQEYKSLELGPKSTDLSQNEHACLKASTIISLMVVVNHRKNIENKPRKLSNFELTIFIKATAGKTQIALFSFL